MPTSSSLVTNLPADFNTFGQAVDTSMSELLGGTTGQVLSKTSNTNMDFTWVTPTDQTPLTTKGDLFAFSTLDARLPAGANETRLVADSAQTLGLKYVADTTNYAIAAKGDLLAGTAADTLQALTVGSNGETLVADSSTSTGLRYQGNYAAGKNAIINGAFNVWQRGTSFSNPANGSYLADRWTMYNGGAPTTYSYSQQAFTAGTAPVAGYEGTYFMRSSITTVGSNTAFLVFQKIEDVRTYAGNAVTVSFWAKADSARSVAVSLQQSFGSGGSGDVNFTAGTASVTTSWTRFTYTVSLTSISGKTIGTGSSLNLIFTPPSASGMSFDLWGVQVETGSVATAFQTATGTLQGELAACQRYYYRLNASGYSYFCTAANRSTTVTDGTIFFPVTMRTSPTLSFSAGNTFMNYENGSIIAGTAIAADSGTLNTYGISLTVASGLTAGRAGTIRANNTSAYVDFSSEL